MKEKKMNKTSSGAWRAVDAKAPKEITKPRTHAMEEANRKLHLKFCDRKKKKST